MKLITLLDKLVKLEDRIEIVALSGKSLLIADSGEIPARYLQCDIVKIEILGFNLFRFTIV